MLFTADPINHVTTAPVDWAVAKADILAGLDVALEFERLGVEFSRPEVNSKGLRECHALGRKDDVPSAFVNPRTGVYHDSGGEGETLHLFDFALKHGQYGRWIDVVKFYAARAGVELPSRPVGKGGAIREALYEYRDTTGAVRYAVFRKRLPNGKKTFSQHPPDGHGGWQYGSGCMDGVAPLPYRLPQLLASNPAEDPVWIVEGEKDADRLESLGLIATTNHQGAQSTDLTWPRFLEHFAGRECYVIPDNDPGGRNHARKVLDYLLPVARVVKLLTLPELPPKGDVSDWLDLGHDLDELGRLAVDAAVWSTQAAVAEPVEDPNRDATAADIRLVIATQPWIWTGWIPPGELVLLAAEGGIGKTRFCFDLHRRIHLGLCWPDGSPIDLPRDSRFLWVAADNQWQEIATIPAEFGIPDDLVILNATIADPFAGTSLQTEEELADLEARIARVRPVLTVIDTITNTADYKSQDSSDAKRQYKPLQEIASRLRTTILCTTHLNVEGKVLGRRAVEKVRVVVHMACPDPDTQPNRRRLWVSKSKAIRPAPLGVTMGDGGNEYDDAPPEAPDPGKRRAGVQDGRIPKKLNECMVWLRGLLADGQRHRVKEVRDAAEVAEFSPTTLYAARDGLGVEEVADGLRNYKFWSLVGPDNGRGAPVF